MNLNRNRIMDGGRWKPRQRVIKVEVVKDGRKVVEERLEKLHAIVSLKMLNPAGSVIDLDLGNANAQAEDGRTPYYEQRLRRKLALGFIPWGRCPAAMVASGELSQRALKREELRTAAPCVGGNHGPTNPCPHALAEQDHRKAAHDARDNGRHESYKAEAERDREQRERHHEELLASQRKGADDNAAAIRAALEAIADTKKRKGDG